MVAVNDKKKAAAKKKSTSKKTASKKKTAAKKATKVKKLAWHIPGHAKSTVFFTKVRTTVYIELMPGMDSGSKVTALIGDEITKDDILDIEEFDTILLSSAPNRRFVRVLITNLEPHEIEVELAFMFVGADSGAGVKYPFKIAPNDFIVTAIPVEIKGA